MDALTPVAWQVLIDIQVATGILFTYLGQLAQEDQFLCSERVDPSSTLEDQHCHACEVLPFKSQQLLQVVLCRTFVWSIAYARRQCQAGNKSEQNGIYA